MKWLYSYLSLMHTVNIKSNKVLGKLTTYLPEKNLYIRALYKEKGLPPLRIER